MRQRVVQGKGEDGLFCDLPTAAAAVPVAAVAPASVAAVRGCGALGNCALVSQERHSALRVQAAGSGKRHRRRPGRRRAARDGGTPKRAVRAELVCLPPTCVWVDSQTEPFEGRGKTKRTSDSVDDIESNPERPEILDESCRRRHELPPPLVNLSTTERKHNSTSCALWSLPRIFLFCAPVGGGGRSQERVLSPC